MQQEHVIFSKKKELSILWDIWMISSRRVAVTGNHWERVINGYIIRRKEKKAMNGRKQYDKRCNSIAFVQCFRFKIYITMGENYAKDD